MQDDAPGNVLGLVGAGGALAAGYAYDAWGQVTAAGEAGLGGWSNPRRFAGREWDAETGLYSNRARYYDPSLRRFLSQDPIELDGGINWYAYAGNDPVNNSDLSGMCEVLNRPGFAGSPAACVVRRRGARGDGAGRSSRARTSGA